MTSEIESLSSEFAKLAGIEPRAYWWCSHCLSEKSPVQVTYYEKCTYCGNHVEWIEGPDFTDAREVIKVMRENDMIHKFAENQGWPCKDGHYCVPLHYIYTTGLLRDEAIRFLEERNA